MSSNWADDSGDLPPPMSGGGGGSSAPAAAPSGGYVSRQRSQSPADASAPDAPLTTPLDPFTRAEASPRMCPRTHAIALRANATVAASAETIGEAVRHPTQALRTFSARKHVLSPTTAHRPRKRSAAGKIFHFSASSATESRAIGSGGDATPGCAPRSRCTVPRGDCFARSSADAARETAVRGTEQTLNARENARSGSAPRCAFRGFRGADGVLCRRRRFFSVSRVSLREARLTSHPMPDRRERTRDTQATTAALSAAAATTAAAITAALSAAAATIAAADGAGAITAVATTDAAAGGRAPGGSTARTTRSRSRRLRTKPRTGRWARRAPSP